MKEIWYLSAALLLATPVLAAEFSQEQLESAARDVKAAESAEAVLADIDAAEYVDIRVGNAPDARRAHGGPSLKIRINKTDAGWADVVAAVKASAGVRKTEAETKLEAVGVTRKPRPADAGKSRVEE
jgi:hypothetical protein